MFSVSKHNACCVTDHNEFSQNQCTLKQLPKHSILRYVSVDQPVAVNYVENSHLLPFSSQSLPRMPVTRHDYYSQTLDGGRHRRSFSKASHSLVGDSTSPQHQTRGSPYGRCSVPACSVLPPVWDSRWYGDQVHRSRNNQLPLCAHTHASIQSVGQLIQR